MKQGNMGIEYLCRKPLPLIYEDHFYWHPRDALYKLRDRD